MVFDYTIGITSRIHTDRNQENTIMMISLITAWIAAICVIFTAFKYFAKKNKTMNRFFRSVHIPMGVLLIAAGLVHGLLAGNPLGTALRQASVG